MLLVTGGAGFIGSHVVRTALASGRRVRVLDDLSTGDAARIPDEAELVEGDVADPGAVRAALHDVGEVAHLAAHRAVPRSVLDPLATDRANTAGTLCVLECAREVGVRRVVLASSSSVYGSAAALPTDETATPRPRSPYAVSKLAGEHYGRVYAELFGVSTISLRLFNVYGPGQSPHGPYAQLVPRVLGALVAGEPPVVDGDGTQSRDLVYVEDVARAFLAALDADPRAVERAPVVNVGTGRTASVLDVLEAARRVTGSADVTVQHAPGRAGDVPATCANPTLAAAVLGWRAEVGLVEGLTRTAAAMAAAAAESTEAGERVRR
jgi:UDP-glucose 4-epimerase